MKILKSDDIFNIENVYSLISFLDLEKSPVEKIFTTWLNHLIIEICNINVTKDHHGVIYPSDVFDDRYERIYSDAH